MKAEGRKFSFLCGHDSNLASVLAAMDVQEYLLMDSVEQHTPIGVKLVFSRWLNDQGEAYWTAELVYQNTRQLRERTPLSLETPPSRFTLHFEGVEDQGGRMKETDLMQHLDDAINSYDEIVKEYSDEEAAAA